MIELMNDLEPWCYPPGCLKLSLQNYCLMGFHYLILLIFLMVMLSHNATHCLHSGFFLSFLGCSGALLLILNVIL